MAKGTKPASKIKLTKEEFSNWFDRINNWLVNVASYFEKDSPNIMSMINDKNKREVYITEKIKKCEKGWNNNSDRFELRIKSVFGYDSRQPNHWYSKTKKAWLNIEDMKSGKIKAPKEKMEAIEVLSAGNNIEEMKDIYSEIISSNYFNLDEYEKAKVYDLISKLYKTFSFNDANDRSTIKDYCLTTIRHDRLYKTFLEGDTVNYQSNLQNSIRDCSKTLKEIQDTLGISAKNRREHESSEMTIADLVEMFNESVSNYEDIVKQATEEFIVLIRGYQAGKIHPSIFKYTYGISLEEMFEAIDSHYIIRDDEGNIMKPNEFQKYVEAKASSLVRKTLKDYDVDIEEIN